MTANEIMRRVRTWHEQIGDMPSKQVGPEVRQIYREMERVIAQHGNAYEISRNRQQEPHSQRRRSGFGDGDGTTDQHPCRNANRV